jgi:hypothetical protein
MDKIRHLRNRRLRILAALTVLIALIAAPVYAAEPRGGDQVVVARGEVIDDDLYVTANTVTIDGTIKGDLVAIANQVVVNGTIEGDLLAAGQGVLINGAVGDDVRAGGQAIKLGPGARVGGDLVIGGLSLETQPSSVVKGDLLVGAYQALLGGEIGRTVRGGLNRMELRGAVGGDVDVALSGETSTSAVQFAPAGPIIIPTVPPNLTLGDTARIAGTLSYTSSAEAARSSAAQIGAGINRHQPTSVMQATPQPVWLGYLQRLATLLLIGALLLWLAPAWTRRLADTVEERPLPSLGWGVLAAAAFVVAMLLLLIGTIAVAAMLGFAQMGGLAALIVGLGMLVNGALLLSGIGFMAFVAQAVLAFAAGRWLLQKTRPAWAERPVIPLVVGVVLYLVLRAIPGLGTLVGLLVVLLALGALWKWGQAVLQRSRRAAPPLGLQPA